MEKCGIPSRESVCAWKGRPLLVGFVCLLKVFVSVTKYGILPATAVFARQVYGIVVYDVCQFPPAHQTKSTTLSTTSVTVTQVMFGCRQGVFVVILLVQWVKDGMVLDVWQFHALQTPTTMVLSVFVRILEINVYHGRYMME